MSDNVVGIPNLDSAPVYHDFLLEQESYMRIHIHLIGVRGTNGGGGMIAKRRNKLGTIKVMDAVPDPYVIVETVGKDTGSPRYFPIGKHKFPTLTDTRLPLWDAKCMLISKSVGTTGLSFTMMDENRGTDHVLMKFVLPKSKFPKPVSPSLQHPGKWTEYVQTATSGSMKNVDFVFKIKVTRGQDWIVSPQDTQTMLQDTSRLTYEEVELLADNHDPTDNALLQVWKQKEAGGAATTKAVLWILGRNDCFMHPHVAQPLFWDRGYDFYVLNYSSNGATRKRGWVTDAHFNSHNKYQDFDVYIEQIDKALGYMLTACDYEKVLGYAHSTGGPVLLDYLMEKGDDDFDGFIFNSPFLDWGFVGGDLAEFCLEHTGFMQKLGLVDADTKLGVETTPRELPPISYLGEDIILSAWSAKIWSLYHWDWATRPLYKVPMTAGFAKGVTKVHQKLENMHKKSKRAVTSKPFVVLSSRGDDVLKSDETTSRCDWIGPARTEVELNDNAHDVFLSLDSTDTVLAIDMVQCWIKAMEF